eukprot:5141162-Pyramimonas_sp.AAC.1
MFKKSLLEAQLAAINSFATDVDQNSTSLRRIARAITQSFPVGGAFSEQKAQGITGRIKRLDGAPCTWDSRKFLFRRALADWTFWVVNAIPTANNIPSSLFGIFSNAIGTVHSEIEGQEPLRN